MTYRLATLSRPERVPMLPDEPMLETKQERRRRQKREAERRRYPLSVARNVADELCAVLEPGCHRLIVAGSVRRGKPDVGDIEILYIARTEVRKDPCDMFGKITVNLANEIINDLECACILERRKNIKGTEMFGQLNKLMRHVASGIPVDLFAASEQNWYNYLVCRTGPADSNTLIATRAKAQGWHWNPYGFGFSRGDEVRPMSSERDVFEFVGMQYLIPENRK